MTNIFVQKMDVAHKPGLSPLQRVVTALRRLAYGYSSDPFDEYVRVVESTAQECLKRFCLGVVEVYEAEYLRLPQEKDVKRLMAVGEKRVFPGMLESIDCIHWTWKKYPTA